MKNAVIIIPENIDGLDCQTNEVHPIVIYNALNFLQDYFSKKIIKLAEKEVGSNSKLQEQWIDKKTKQLLGNNPDDKKLDINKFN